MKTVVVVHTGPSTVQPIKQQFQAILPDVRVINLMDDSLLNDVIVAGHLTDAVSGRLLSYMRMGEEMGACAVLNACSSVGEAASAARSLISIPIVKIDDAMAETAVAQGPRVGVVATVRTTLEPTVRLIRAKAAAQQREVEIVEALADGAFQATIESLSGRVDVIVLAQASMARLIPALTGLEVPVLSSPQSGVEALRAVLAQMN
jgi:Asp/Glu/hydantoin racemase